MAAIRCLSLGLLVSIFTAATVSAEPMLLAEISYEQPEPVTLPAEYSLNTNDLEGNVFWADTVTSFPFTSHATGETLERLNEVFTHANNPATQGAPITLASGGQFPDADPNDGVVACFVCAFRPLLLLQHRCFPRRKSLTLWLMPECLRRSTFPTSARITSWAIRLPISNAP